MTFQNSERHDPYAALRYRDFRLLLTGRFITSFGNEMLSFAIGWELWLRTHKPFVLGMSRFGPDPTKPYFRKRYMMPTPLENSDRKVIDAAGLHTSFRGHNHSPALEVPPNGHVLLVIYTSYIEYEPGVSLIAARLRFGAEEWDMPSPWMDFATVNDHAPLLWVEQGVLRLFWVNPKLACAFPFQWIESTDKGATLGPVQFLNTPLRFLNADASVDGPPPALVGEHTDEILGHLLAIPATEIGTLRSRGIVA